jgi:photosystem II CP47 chlorophyll apoprotein
MVFFIVYYVRLPWFRVHTLVINDPGRLISVHLAHTALVAGWSSIMLTFELIILDPSDVVFSPIWRQGLFVTEFASRLGVVSSYFAWSIGSYSFSSYWCFESVVFAHLLLSGLLFLAAFWHWAFWDLDIFISTYSFNLCLDLPKILGIHLLISAAL